MLHDMVSDSEEPYNGIIWQLVCCPFTPMLVLFGDILSDGEGKLEEHKEALVAMQQLPAFLSGMSIRHSLAAKLQRIAEVFVQHATSVIASRGMCVCGTFR